MNRPKITRAELEALIVKAGYQLADKLMIVGIRGYYKDTMGKPGTNDRGIYDDAIILISPDYFETFNGNTDPSKYQPGIAMLKPGLYEYKQGIHGVHHINSANPKDKAAYDWLLAHPGQDHQDPAYRLTYWAFRQYSNVTVFRDGGKEQTDSPATRFWIDIHRGGINTTSSDGCQTIIPEQWVPLRKTAYDLMNKAGQKTINYLLLQIEY